ncbi:putative Cytochrome oxidase c subunit VIII-containing protein [Homarus americanus]|uniref:Putative Cytochrome oxidase c subunit VIII-containing protein n=1 Tax=Homarus americanus TaxID=6706 RepID=A0A8J5JNV7_HOMAM|nr:putative Cytochrome oxidase c subunit VIII-containing protein [Homarus americanus]
MFALRTAVTQVARANTTMVMAKRTSVISGPPTVKVSFAEKMVHGGVIMVGCCAVPAWVLAHIKEYRGREE